MVEAMFNPRTERQVTRYSTRGTPFQVWEPFMPRISDDFLHCCIYLYPSEKDAEEGIKIGGSGFLVAVPCKKLPGSNFIYAVTNRHVIESGNTVVRLNTVDGKTDIFDLNERSWSFHPDGDDLAIAGLPPLDEKIHRYKLLSQESHFITREIIQELNVGPGDDTFVVGRFINQEGRQRNLPSVRFGHLAQMPPEPIRQRRGMTFFDQESFIVEAKSIGGYSGSPVMVAFNPTLQRPERNGLTSNRAYLLGVGWGYITDWMPICDQNGSPIANGYQVQSNTGMMGVVPAWKLTDFLNHPANVTHRNNKEDEILKQNATLPATPTSSRAPARESVSPPASGENPTHREDFMRLVGAAARKPAQED
jgi:hypothetical protein